LSEDGAIKCIGYCHGWDDDDNSSDGTVNDMGDIGGYSPPATASNWENGGSLLGGGILLPIEGGSEG